MEKGDFVRIDYIGRIKDTGEIFDLTNEETAKKEKIYREDVRYGPVPVIVGENFVIKGLDSEIAKMQVGEKKSVSIPCTEAFGERDPKMIKVLPMSVFRKQKVEPSPGLIVNMSGYKGRIQSCDSGRVRVDFNNPLAGKDIEYEIEIREKIEEPVAQVRSIFEFMGIRDVDVKINGSEAEVEINISIHPNLKERITELIKTNVKAGSTAIERVRFSEVFGAKKEEPAEKALESPGEK